MAEKKAEAGRQEADRAPRPRAGGSHSPASRRRGAARSPKVNVVNAANQTVREIQLSPEVFAAKPNTHLVYEAVKQYRAGGARGTHATKNRALVSGSGKKPWRQKGTGRARAGETRNPLWRHGGTVFGPQPRDYSYTMPKKARAAALRAALSSGSREGALKVVEGFAVERAEDEGAEGHARASSGSRARRWSSTTSPPTRWSSPAATCRA